jgi:hypothetical protein
MVTVLSSDQAAALLLRGAAARMSERPLAIDLFTGLHGWAEGLIAAGWDVIGFDLEDMSKLLGEPKPKHFWLVIQDVLTLHGAQLKDAQLIVGSSPCQEFSYRAMPWKRAKALGPPELGMALFHAQFRIRQEASEAAGRPIPIVVENVRGAIPWVGRSRANFGSYYLWGDVAPLMPIVTQRKTNHDRRDPKRDEGGSWFAQSHSKVVSNNPARGEAIGEGRKLPGFRDPDCPTRQGGQKAAAKGWFNDSGDPDRMAMKSSKSPARKAASAKIAKIPFALAYWIGLAHLPGGSSLADHLDATGLRSRYLFREVGRDDDGQLSLFG